MFYDDGIEPKGNDFSLVLDFSSLVQVDALPQALSCFLC